MIPTDDRPRDRRRWAALLAVALVVAVGVPAGWALTRPDPDVGSLAALRTPAPADPADPADPEAGATPPPAAVPDAARPAPAPDPDPAVPGVPVRSGRLDARPPDPADPVRVRVPARAIDAPVVPVGVEPATGGMEIPEDVDDVGLYTPNPAPGAPEGSSVLSGHVDSRVQGRGAFFPLEQVQPGDVVTVDLADGTALDYEVIARTRYPKAELPLAEVFSTAGPHHLTLITCGGAFDSIDRQYQDNVVVVAVPTRT